jgi:hypothetical protein
MKEKWNMSFASVENKLVTMEHYSTASVIRIAIKSNESEQADQSIWLDYAQMDALVNVIKRLQE